MELVVLSYKQLVHNIKELKLFVMDLQEIVFHAQILKLLLQLMLVKIKLVLLTPQLKATQSVRPGYLLVFGKERQAAQTLDLALHLQEQLTHVLYLLQMMDLVMEQVHHHLPVLQIIYYAQLHQQPLIQMSNAKLGDQLA